jgi:uridine kinase
MGDVLDTVADAILALHRPHPVRVGIDGRTAAGKTTFAGSLAALLRRRTERPIIEVGLDYFKLAITERVAYPLQSPESYYLDSWNYPAFRDRVLLPLGPDGSRRYRTRIMNLRGTEPIMEPDQVAAEDAILVVDGAFLQRPQLHGLWDLTIWLDVDESHSFERGMARDAATIGLETEHRYRTKYLPGEQRYISEERPAIRADIVVDNRDPSAPRILRP